MQKFCPTAKAAARPFGSRRRPWAADAASTRPAVTRRASRGPVSVPGTVLSRRRSICPMYCPPDSLVASVPPRRMRRRRRRLRTTTRRWRAAYATRRRRAPSPAATRVPGSIPRGRCSASARRRRRPEPELTPMLHRRRDVPTTSASPPRRPPEVARTRAGARRDARAGYPRAGTRAGHGARGRDAARGRPRASLREGTGGGMSVASARKSGRLWCYGRVASRAVGEDDGVGRRAGSGAPSASSPSSRYPSSHGVTSPAGASVSTPMSRSRPA